MHKSLQRQLYVRADSRRARSRRILNVDEDWNLLLEIVEAPDAAPQTSEYFWGNDLSGSEQGAGGVGGLLAVSINGNYYLPLYDHNGNIIAYCDEQGLIVATYTYDAFGNTIEQTGSMASAFAHRFSTKYYDAETSLYYYGYRFYSPTLSRWLNRDPIEEDGGLNLYAFCENNGVAKIDVLGKHWFYKVSDFCAGAADSLTMGLTQVFRRSLNQLIYNNWDDFDVPFYDRFTLSS